MKTVLFDMDGTLLDTERIYQDYWFRAADELGYDLTKDDLLEFRSLGRNFAIEKMYEKTGSREAYDEIRNYRRKLMDPYMEKIDIPLKPGVKEALKILKDSEFTLAVATATAVDITRKYLKRSGIVDFFDILVSSKMVPEGKPSPDVYLYACEKIGVNPGETFAVEDAPNGVLSAFAAGCRVIMVPDLTEPDEELLNAIEYRADSIVDAATYILRKSVLCGNLL